MNRPSKRFILYACILACAGGLAGCAQDMVPGLAPTLDAADLDNSTRNYLEVERLLVERAGFQDAPHGGAEQWYPVVVAGYGYIDEKCNAFMDQLFEEERRLRASRNQLNDIAGAVTTILTATSVARADIGIVAAAFGLASDTIDNYQIIRLVDLGPAKVQTLVSKAQQAYRAQTNADWRIFNNRAFAMRAIAGYLEICRVPTIIASIARAIEVAYFVADDNGGDPLSPRLRLVARGEASTDTIREEAGLARLTQLQPRNPLPRTSPPPVQSVPAGAGNADELSLSISKLRRLQRKLCVMADGAFGPATRRAIREYQEFNTIPKDGFFSYLAINNIDREGDCPYGLKNYTEKRLMVTADSIISIKNVLNGVSEGGTIAINADIDAAFRNKVRAVRKFHNFPYTNPEDDDITKVLGEKLGLS